MLSKIPPYYPTFGSVMSGRSLSGGGNRFGFNGKEKESNFVEGNYDFGARIYDGRLGRWLAVDPLSEKYVSLSVYNFVANSPIVYLDPDGKRIIIAGTLEEKKKIFEDLSKITKAKLSLNEETGEVTIEKHNYLKIFKKNNGSRLIRRLIKSEQTVTIETSNNKNSTRPENEDDQNTKILPINKNEQSPVNCKIFYNPNFDGSTILNKDKSTGRPSFIGLAHELIHANYMMSGNTPYEKDRNKNGTIYLLDINGNIIKNEKGDPLYDIGDRIFKDPDTRIKLSFDEVKVRRRENKIRRENNVVKRAIPSKIKVKRNED